MVHIASRRTHDAALAPHSMAPLVARAHGSGVSDVLDQDLRTSPTLVLHTTGPARVGAARTTAPPQPPSSALAAHKRGELRAGEEDLLLALARLAKAVLPATSCTCLTLQESTRTTRTLSDAALGETVDRAQRQAGAGPSLSAHQDREPCCSTDLREDPRWGGLHSRLPSTSGPPVEGEAQRSGQISAVALPLCEGAHVLGVLTVYGIGHPLLTTEQDVAQLITLGVVASQLLALALRVRRAEESAAGLQVALDCRAPVEQAKDIVAARLGLSPEEAFEVISCLSQDRNTKVRDTVAALVRAPGDDGLDAALRATAIRRGLAVR